MDEEFGDSASMFSPGGAGLPPRVGSGVRIYVCSTQQEQDCPHVLCVAYVCTRKYVRMPGSGRTVSTGDARRSGRGTNVHVLGSIDLVNTTPPQTVRRHYLCYVMLC